MFTWGLVLSKTAYPRRKFKTGEAVWRCNDIKGLLDLRDDRAVRRNGASVLKDDMVSGPKKKKRRQNTQSGREDEKGTRSGKKITVRSLKKTDDETSTSSYEFLAHGPHAPAHASA